jgi:hypothetical protein
MCELGRRDAREPDAAARQSAAPAVYASQELELSMERDYWLSLAVYDEFRGVPLRKVIARGYVDLRSMGRSEQALFIRLGSLFFQGRSWRKFAGVTDSDACDRLTEDERDELVKFRSVRRQIGAAVVRLLDDDDTLDQIRCDVIIERLESMGFLDPDYKI